MEGSPMTLTKQFNQKSFEDNYTLFRGSEGVVIGICLYVGVKRSKGDWRVNLAFLGGTWGKAHRVSRGRRSKEEEGWKSKSREEYREDPLAYSLDIYDFGGLCSKWTFLFVSNLPFSEYFLSFCWTTSTCLQPHTLVLKICWGGAVVVLLLHTAPAASLLALSCRFFYDFDLVF